MRKYLMAGALAAALIGPASAANFVDIPLEGTLPKSCEVTAFVNGPFDNLDLTTTAEQGAESLSPICNYGGTLTVDFTSANASSLVSGANSVPYTFSVSGGLLTDATLPATVSNWPAVANAVQSRSMSVTLTNVASVAGTYTDTVTATVTPN